MRDRLVELQCLAYDTYEGGKTSFEHTADVLFANGVVALPCKVGDIVYQIETLFKETTITELTVTELTIDSDGIKTLYGRTNKGSVSCFIRDYDLNNIKFSRREAEKALKSGEQE